MSIDKENVGATGKTFATLGLNDTGFRRALGRRDNTVHVLPDEGTRSQLKRTTVATAAKGLPRLCTPQTGGKTESVPAPNDKVGSLWGSL